jgi:pimeloyl-ACP methyl ester carboxylesterase
VLEKKLSNLTLVVHDFGGAIGFNFAIQQPEKVKNFVILNSWLWSSKTDPDFIKLSRILKSPLLKTTANIKTNKQKHIYHLIN